MELVSWHEVAEYIAAGNVINVTMSDNLDKVTLVIIYGCVSDKSVVESEIRIICSLYSYLDIRRTDSHENGAGVILEASLHTASPLIERLREHILDAPSGCLYGEQEPIYHLEIIGEVNINILCSKIECFRTELES